MPPTELKVIFVSWEGRPAVIIGSRAWAILRDGEGWTEVNSSEVPVSSRVMSPKGFLDAFGPTPRLPGGAAPKASAPPPSSRLLLSWEGRPAVIEGSRAWAILSDGEGWSEVNAAEVSESSRVLSPGGFLDVFGFGLTPLPGGAPLSPSERLLLSWEGRPAVIIGSRAWAILRDGEGWTEVNSSEVSESTRVLSPEGFLDAFGPTPALPEGVTLEASDHSWSMPEVHSEPAISGAPPPPKKSAGGRPSERSQGSSPPKFSPETIALINREAERCVLENAYAILRAKTKRVREAEAKSANSDTTSANSTTPPSEELQMPTEKSTTTAPSIPRERSQVPHYGTSAAYEAAGEKAFLRGMERGLKRNGLKIPKVCEDDPTPQKGSAKAPPSESPQGSSSTPSQAEIDSKPNVWDDARQQTLTAVAARLYQLLLQSENQARDRDLVEAMLYQADLWNQTIPQGASLFRFCNQLVARNPLLYQVIEDVRARPADLAQVDSLEELMFDLIPSQ